MNNIKNNIKDITGQKFGRITVIGFAEIRNRKTYWNCICDCGTKKEFRGDGLKRGVSSCGCARADVNEKEDWSGRIYNKLIVIGYGNCNNFAYVLCKCECGTEKYIRKDHLVIGNQKSCGCYKKQRLDAMPKNKLLHKKEYTCWCKMKERVLNPKTKGYKDYGGRGITIENRYINSFDEFFNDIGEAPGSEYSIERIDVNGNYEKGNIIWADKITQANNTRSNVYVEYNNKTQTVAQWGRELNLKPNVVLKRIHRGWSVEDAFNKPLRITK